LAPLIEKIKSLGKPIYLTGGDAQLLSRFFTEAIVEEDLIFTGMKKLIDKGSKC
jgi:pantothenate kinase type III